VSCLSGSLAVLTEDTFELACFLPNLGEIYSMSGDENFLLTGHTSSNTSIQVICIYILGIVFKRLPSFRRAEFYRTLISTAF
jgi:hypothetical protein